MTTVSNTYEKVFTCNYERNNLGPVVIAVCIAHLANSIIYV